MNIFIAKVAAYLLDRAIHLNPQEVEKAFYENPPFSGGRPLKNYCIWSSESLRFISKLFWDDHYQKPVIEGLFSIGVSKTGDGELCILVTGNEKTCAIFKKKIPNIKQLAQHPIPIYCEIAENATFSSNQSNNPCPGGSCIVPPSLKGYGTLGAWLDIDAPASISLGLTNNHVAAEFNRFPKGTPIADFNGNTIGNIYDYVPLTPWNPQVGDYNLVDIAFISPDSNNVQTSTLGCCGNKLINDFDLEDNFLSGKKTFMCANKCVLKEGYVTRIGVAVYLRNPYNGIKYKFIDIPQIDFGDPGDSGSVIYDGSSSAGGIFFATISGVGFKVGCVNKWEYVSKASGLTFRF
jgi:hypothetical protein